MAEPDRATGGCLCGAVRFEVRGRLYDPHYCHCRTCQKASGAPVIAGAFLARDGYRLTRGALKIYRSSQVVERGFCGACGTYMLYRPLIPEWSAWVIVTLASLDDPGALAPARHYGTESRIAWFDTADDFPREAYEEGFVELLAGGDAKTRAALLAKFGMA